MTGQPPAGTPSPPHAPARPRPATRPDRWWRQPAARPDSRSPHRALRRWALGRSVRLTALLTAAVLVRFVWRLAWSGRG
jgi:hypothetical protein